jgi:hypothetical protein
MNRSDYLKDFLIRRGVPASTLTVRELRHEDVQRMGTYELEWHKRENKKNLDAVITPDERNRRKQSWETEQTSCACDEPFAHPRRSADVRQNRLSLPPLLPCRARLRRERHGIGRCDPQSEDQFHGPRRR